MTRARAALFALAALFVSNAALAQKGRGPRPAPPAPAPAPAAPSRPAPAEAGDDRTKEEARLHFERGLDLLSEEAFDAAHVEFEASRKLFPTKAATKNAAICLRRLKRYDEALDVFESLSKDFPNLADHDRAFAEKEIAALRAFVGTIEVRGGERDAVVAIDGRDRGALPLRGPLRVPTGSHVVRIFKSGFVPFEERVDVVSGTPVAVSVKMNALAQSGRLFVAETGSKHASVVIDNVVVGQAPWEGMLSIGDHSVLLQGEGELASQPAAARVRENQPTRLTLALEPLTSALRVEPVPVNALVAIDGVQLGRGVWEGRLRGGAHRLEVAAEGFVPKAMAISLANGARASEQIGLERDMSSPLWRTPIPSRFLVEGRLGGAIGPGFGGDIAGCDACKAGLVFGGTGRASLGFELGVGLGFTADVGYAWTRQSVDDRATTLSPLPAGSSPAEQGTSDHDLTTRGATVGAGVYFRRGSKLRWTVRTGGGLWLASVVDRRSGSFTTTVSARPDGSTGSPAPYQLDAVEQSANAQYAYVAPEVRLGLGIGKSAEVSLGIEGFLAFALSQPSWEPLSSRVVTGTCRTSATNDCVTDGVGVFGKDKLTGSTFFLLTPGVAFRYEL